MKHTKPPSKHPDPRRQPGELTLLLSSLNDPESLNAVMRMVYDDLHRMAVGHFRGERRNHTLQPTALLHEALMRLIEKGGAYPNGAYFFGAASKAMRRILIEGARRNRTRKRGGDWIRTEFDEAVLIEVELADDLIDFDSALARLEAVDSDLSHVVELRAFGGFTAQETGTILGFAESTVRAKWSTATQWLRRELGGAPEAPPLVHKKVRVAKTVQ